MNINIEYVKPKGFSDERHISNFVNYLFNLSKKYENEKTKENLYFYRDKQGFHNVEKDKVCREFREKEAEFLKRTLFDFDERLIFNDLFYIVYNEPYINISELHYICKNNLNNILNLEDPFLMNIKKEPLYIVAHFNQESPPHLHRVFAVDKEDLKSFKDHYLEDLWWVRALLL